MAARRFDEVSPAIDFLVDAILGTALMLVAHFAFGWAWWAAVLFGYGSISCLVFLLMYEGLGGSLTDGISDFLDDLDWPWD